MGCCEGLFDTMKKSVALKKSLIVLSSFTIYLLLDEIYFYEIREFLLNLFDNVVLAHFIAYFLLRHSDLCGFIVACTPIKNYPILRLSRFHNQRIRIRYYLRIADADR